MLRYSQKNKSIKQNGKALVAGAIAPESQVYQKEEAEVAAYYFYLRSGNINQLGNEICRWAFSDEYSSKEKLRKAMTIGGQSVRAKDIYSGKQLVKEYSQSTLRHILEEILRYQPELRRENRK